MSELKTKPTDASVEAFLNAVDHPQRRADGYVLLQMMKEITQEPPIMWGSSIVGFGSYHYRYASGREGDWFKTGFSPRKRSLSIYLMQGFDTYKDLLSRLGKHRVGKGCLYINKLADVDLDILRAIIKRSFEEH
ncbi:MAG: DUF1801 domain-containing protein [Candidatus Bathyarchaeota archaeon]|nr:DUF1801 domain-containing protein [Candidatus Bathyarchaeota archaeon]